MCVSGGIGHRRNMDDTKKLRRSNDQRILTGVCGGIGEYTGIDANIIRLIFVILAVFGVSTGLILYVIAWLVIPEQGATKSVAEELIGSFTNKGGSQ
jgi:phage shock protein C